METRARYLAIGLFTLAVIAAGFGFVYWLYSGGGFRDRAAYQIRFDGPVSGLLVGSAVLFNGIRVGEVTDLTLTPDNPKEVLATVAIDPSTPVRADTAIGMDFQGLTGAPVIVLTGGSASAPLVNAADGSVPTLVAAPEQRPEHDAGRARRRLQKLDGILADNADPLHTVIENFKTFSDALARNSDKVDSVVAGSGAHDGRRGRQRQAPHLHAQRRARLPGAERAEARPDRHSGAGGAHVDVIRQDPHRPRRQRGRLDRERAMERQSAGAVSGEDDRELRELRLLPGGEPAASTPSRPTTRC